MNQSYILNVTLWVRAPLITSGGGNALRGVDRMFNRNSCGDITLQGSHIKGKLREALNDLQKAKAPINLNIDEWFGLRGGEESYDPNRSRLIFDDFCLEQAEKQILEGSAESVATRVAIDKKTGTGIEHQLFVTERQFPSGAMTVWKGGIRFWEADQRAADKIAEQLTLGLKWMNTLGGIKGSGYGRLEKVVTRLEACKYVLPEKGIKSGAQQFRLLIEFENDLFVGGIVNSTNYLESQKIIPGAVLKGSLARFLNEMCGESLATAIKPDGKVAGEFPNLAKYFWATRFSHAFPAPVGSETRPVAIPLSAIKDSEDNYYDIALFKESTIDSRGKAPEFRIEWKDPARLDSDFGWAKCRIVNKTRTAIFKETRTAEANKLYTFQYISPYAESKVKSSAQNRPPKIRWIANITLPDKVDDPAILADEFYRALHSGWERLGKRSSRFSFELKESHAASSVAQTENILTGEGEAIITLQTEALLLDGYEYNDLNNLQSLYSDYWREATEDSCEQTHFFARQRLYGGYFGMWKPYKLHAQGNYYPYLLTEAGSVFVLKAKAGDRDRAGKILERLKAQGLPLPETLEKKLKEAGIAEDHYWQKCPFVPQNGFGEIAINLEWHWKHRMPENKR
jgi:hypothetical protein